MARYMELYHCTTQDKLESILKEGLIPHEPRWCGKPSGKPVGVYLSTSPFGWMEYVITKERLSGLSEALGMLLKVNVRGLNIVKEDHEGDALSITGMDELLDKDHICLEHIPVEQIISISIETTPGRFVDMERTGRRFIG